VSETNDDGELPRADVPKMARLIEGTGDYAFLIGAGTSRPRPSSILTAGELIDEWREECYRFEHPNENDPSEEAIADWAEGQQEADGIEQSDEYGYWFDRFRPDPAARREYIQDLVEGADPTTGHLVLASMMSGRSGEQQVPLTLTPNFDDLLFDAFYLLSEERPQIINHRAVVPEFQITRDDPAIVKLHGDYLYSNLRNTGEETDRLNESMETVLTETTEQYGLVVVGYSGRDDSIMSALEQADISGNRLYWCVRRPREHHDADTVDEKISDRAAELVRESDGRIVEIEGFNSLMSRFRKLIDGLPPVTEKDELQNRFDERVAQLDEILEERSDAEPSQAEKEELGISELSDEAAEAAKEGNFKYAKSLYNRLMDRDGENVTRLGIRGSLKQELGDYEGAIADYNKVVEINPQEPLAYHSRGDAKYMIGNYEDAIADYDQAVEVDPEYSVVYYNRGNAKRALGDYKGAIADYNQALKHDPENDLILRNRSEVKILLGQSPEAKQDAERARDLSDTTDENATSSLLYLIAVILLEEDTQPQEQEYRDLCEQEFTTSWSFEELDTWLEDADLDPEKEAHITELMNLLREHKAD